MDYQEKQELPDSTWKQRLAFVSQLDKLDQTTADEARCSAAASLSGYLLLGGDYQKVAQKLNMTSDKITYEHIHLMQDKIYHLANVDSIPGIYGLTRAIYDEQGRIAGWEFKEDDEYHLVLEFLGLKAHRIFAEFEDQPTNKKSQIQPWLEGKEPVVFVVGVMEDLEQETFFPMGEGLGNHYILIFNDQGILYALDSWKTPGKIALSKLSDQQVIDHLYQTHNAIYALTLN